MLFAWCANVNWNIEILNIRLYPKIISENRENFLRNERILGQLDNAV